MEPEKKGPRERAEDLIRLLVPDWRPTARQGLWAIRIVLATVIVLGLLTLVGQPFGITLWDWLKLLVVPAVIAGGGLWFNRQQRERELELAERRTQDEALQAYLDQMSGMLIPKTDQPSLYKARPGDSLSSVARARTLTVLPRLDSDRKARVVKFLHESGLIAKDRPIVAMRGADLRKANLTAISLSDANLTAVFWRLQRLGRLKETKSEEVGLSAVGLRETDMTDFLEATWGTRGLSDANLSGVNLSGVVLSGAQLGNAFLYEADLSGANLTGANLSEANLTDAVGVSKEMLEQQAETLEFATMPNGQKYEN